MSMASANTVPDLPFMVQSISYPLELLLNAVHFAWRMWNGYLPMSVNHSRSDTLAKSLEFRNK
jgi:hypothetical protein